MGRRKVGDQAGTPGRPVGVKDTYPSAVRLRPRIFEMWVSGVSPAQIADTLDVTRVSLRKITDDPAFREQVAQFRSARLDEIARSIESGSRAAVGTLIECSRGVVVSPSGEKIPIEPASARERTRASRELLLFSGFSQTQKVQNEHSGTVALTPPSAEDLARLSALLGDDDDEED